MAAQAWNESFVRCLGVELFGDSIDVDEHGEDIVGDTVLLLFNADHANAIPFTLPAAEEGQEWELTLDTAAPKAQKERFPAEHQYPLQTCSVAMFRLAKPAAEDTT